MKRPSINMDTLEAALKQRPDGALRRVLAEHLDWAPFKVKQTLERLKRAGRVTAKPARGYRGNVSRWFAAQHVPATMPESAITAPVLSPIQSDKPAPRPQATRSGVIAGPRLPNVFVPLDVARHLASLRPAGSYRRTA